jgi:hypothetical protein
MPTTTSAHTPGPWRFVAYTNAISPTTGNGVIAKIPPAGPDPLFPRPDIAEANARLIAAAPELLHQLYMVLPYLEDLQDSDARRSEPTYKPGALARIVQETKAAIAKASA